MKKFGKYYFIITQTISFMIMPELITWFICYKLKANNVLMYSLIGIMTLVGVTSGILFLLKSLGIIGTRKIIDEVEKDIKENENDEKSKDEKN